MPIYMDRHDARGTTREQVAELHRRDLAMQDQLGVRFLTYWFDEAPGTVFCLIDAPDPATASRAHRESHGHLASDIIEVDLSAVEAFLGRMQDPKPAPSRERAEVDPAFRTVMFTDIVGSTEMTARLGDLLATEAVRAHDSLVRSALRQHGGREIKHTGDGIMASSDAAPAAVDCARAIQRAFDHYNARSGEPIRVRIGMRAGERWRTPTICSARPCRSRPDFAMPRRQGRSSPRTVSGRSAATGPASSTAGTGI